MGSKLHRGRCAPRRARNNDASAGCAGGAYQCRRRTGTLEGAREFALALDWNYGIAMVGRADERFTGVGWRLGACCALVVPVLAGPAVWRSFVDDGALATRVDTVFTGCAVQVAALDSTSPFPLPGTCTAIAEVPAGSDGVAESAAVAADRADAPVTAPPAEGSAHLPAGSCGSLFTPQAGLAGDDVAPVVEGQPVTPDMEAARGAQIASLLDMPPESPLQATAPRAQAVAQRPVSKPRPAHPPPIPPRPDDLAAWWPAPQDDRLNVLFVGGANFGSAISLLTDGHFVDAASANASIEVRTQAGGRVTARWVTSTNPRMLLLKVDPGIYSVSIAPALADRDGRRLGSAAAGRVYVN